MEVNKKLIEGIPVISCDIKDAKEYSELISEYIIKEIDENGHECYSYNKYYYTIINNTKLITWNTKGFIHLIRIYKKYKKLFRKIEIKKPDNCLKVGIIGELYTNMEPFSNYFIEKTLASMNVQIKRRTDVTYLVVTKRFNTKRLLKVCGKYCKYTIGADGMDNVAEAKMLAEKGYDGLIHTKPFGCMPEIGAVSILQKLSSDYKIPIIYRLYIELPILILPIFPNLGDYVNTMVSFLMPIIFIYIIYVSLLKEKIRYQNTKEQSTIKK
jgi:hypothetical protein